MCLALCGVPLAMLLNFVVPVFSWSPVIMASSAILLFDGFNKQHKSVNKPILKVIILFQLLMVLYWLINPAHDFKMLAFHLFVICFYFVIRGNGNALYCNYLSALFLYSGFLSIVFAILEYLGFFSYDYWVLMGASDASEKTLEFFTANIAAYTNLVTCNVLLSKRNKWGLKLFYLGMCIVDMYVIMYSGKRSYFVASLFVISYFLFKTKAYKKYLPLIVGAFIFAMIAIPEVRDSFVGLIERTFSGFTDVYGGKKVAYDENSSSAIRAYNLGLTLKAFNNFSFLELIFGRGYLAFYIDNPLLESYMDMGFLGFIFYSLIVVIYPIVRLVKNRIQNNYSTLTLLLLFFNTTICFTNNNPYVYYVYTPAILLAIYSNRVHQSIKNK